MLAFEREHAASARRLHDEHSRHIAVVDDLGEKVESVAKYLQQKDRALNSEQKAASGRRTLRSARMRWVSEALQHAFADLIETLHECRSDAARLSRAKLVKTAALELCEKIQARLDECRCAHTAKAKQLKTSLEVQERFAEWLRDASTVTIAKTSSNNGTSEANRITTKARLLTLAHSVQGQVCTDRSSGLCVGEGPLVEQWAKCPHGEQLQARGVEGHRATLCHEQEKQQSSVMERPVCKFTRASKTPEQHISQDITAIMGRLNDSGELKGISDDEWATQIRDAEAWVASFLFTNVVGGNNASDCEPSPSSPRGFSTPRENSKTRERSLQGDIRRDRQDQSQVENGMGRQIHATPVVAPKEAADEESLVVSESHIECITPESISAFSPDPSKMLEAPPSCFLRLRHLQAQGELLQAAASGSDATRSKGGGNGTSMKVAMTGRRPLSAGPRRACNMLGKATTPVPTHSAASAMYCTTKTSDAPMRLSATPPAQARLPRPSSDATLEVPQTRTQTPPELALRLAASQAPKTTPQTVHQAPTRASTPPHPTFFAAAASAAAEPKQRLTGQQAASCEAPCRMVGWLPHEPIAAARTVGSSYAPVRHSLPADGRLASVAATRGSVRPSFDGPQVRAASLPTKR